MKMQKRWLALVLAMMWFVVGCPKLEIVDGFDIADDPYGSDTDVDVDTDVDELCPDMIYSQLASVSCMDDMLHTVVWEHDWQDTEMPQKCSGDCEEWLYGFESCQDTCGPGADCDALLVEYEMCVGGPVEPKGDCEEIEEFYRTCANTLGPDHYSCWVFQEELLHCWLSVEGGWCDSLEGMYYECQDRFGPYHHGCQDLGWELSNDCGIWVEPPYYQDCEELNWQLEECTSYYGWGSEMCWGYEDALYYECGYYYPGGTDDIDTGWDTGWNIDTDWDTDTDYEM